MKQVLILGLAMGLVSQVHAQSSVSTNGVKHVLVEESTGAWCGYCPDGSIKLDELIASNNRVIGVSIHGGASADSMKFPDGDLVTSTYFAAFPLAMVDRVPTGTPLKPAMDIGFWNAATTSQLSLPADFDVTLDHGFDDTNRVINAQVKVKALNALAGSFNVNLYVVEDSVSGNGVGWDQVNYFNNQSGHYYFGAGDPILGFQHMHVVRAMLGGPFGSSGVIANNPAFGSIYSKTYSYTVPLDFNWKRIKLVATVQKENSSDINDRVISNAIESKLTRGKLLNTNRIASYSSIEVAPNPASRSIIVKGAFPGPSDMKISLLNTLGQEVQSRIIACGSRVDFVEILDVGDLSNGIYFLHVINEEGKKTTQVLVNR